MKHYWGEIQTQAVAEYQTSEMDRRNEIFETILYPAIDKLVECVLARSSVYTRLDKQEVRNDALQHAVSYLDRLDTTKNCFAYLQLSIKHYIYQLCAKSHKLDMRDVALDMESSDGDDLTNMIEGQMSVEIDNNPMSGEDIDAMLVKVLDFWTLPKLKNIYPL